jgi:hypothetical protein
VVLVAALTPRVRLATVCDRVRESLTEAGVYHLRGVRQRIVAPAFPFVASRLWLFLVLSSPRPGTYPGYVRVINAGTDKTIFFAHLAPHPRFKAGDDILAVAARLRCAFPHAGRYTVQVWFYPQQGSDVLKAELPFAVAQEGDRPVKKKSSKKMLGPTLQEFELVPVTDAAELAALDRWCRAAEKAKAAAERAGKGKPTKRK